MAEDARTEDGGDTPRAGRPVVFPLNSRRLVTQYVHQIAAAMELPTKASPANLRQMVEGKLIASGREPQNVQVRVIEREDGLLLELQDMSGVFLEAQPVVPEFVETEDTVTALVTDPGELEDVGELRVALQVANEEREALKEVVEINKKRLNEVWSENCRQLRVWDAHQRGGDQVIEDKDHRLGGAAPSSFGQ